MQTDFARAKGPICLENVKQHLTNSSLSPCKSHEIQQGEVQGPASVSGQSQPQIQAGLRAAVRVLVNEKLNTTLQLMRSST